MPKNNDVGFQSARAEEGNYNDNYDEDDDDDEDDGDDEE